MGLRVVGGGIADVLINVVKNWGFESATLEYSANRQATFFSRLLFALSIFTLPRTLSKSKLNPLRTEGLFRKHCRGLML